MPAPTPLRRLTLEQTVAAVGGDPDDLVRRKVLDHLDAHCRRFIELSPWVAVATYGAAGDADVSPRGDSPGSIRILDDRTLAIPERPGNRLADTLRNVHATGRAGLLFLVPGVDETLRVNGRAFVTDDPELIASMEVRGRTPACALVVEVEQAFLHCAKAFIRSKLWDPAAQVDRRTLPTLAAMIHDQIEGLPPVPELDEWIEDGYRTTLY